MTTGIRNLTRICLAAVLAFGLAACGGGGAKKTEAELEMERLAALEMECTSAGGRWNADNTCTSADEREMEARQMACTDAGGRYESDGTCTSAADLEAERLAAAEATCTGSGGRWESDNTCTSAADVLAEVAEANCTAGGGRYNADGTCTSAADLAAERAEMACTGASGQWNADGTCTTAAELAQMACEGADGRWNADGTCTDAAGLLAEQEMACTGADGRWNDDNTCTDAAGLLAEQEMACTGAGGRWNGDTAADMCSDVTELAAEQRTDINGKIAAAQSAVDAVNDESSGAMVTAADNAIAAASMAIADAANIGATEKAAFTSAVGAIRTNLASRKSSRQMAMEDAEDMANQAMAATAAKLYTGIGAPMGVIATPAADDLIAGYDDVTPLGILVRNGDSNGDDSVTADDNVTLSLDKKTMVDANHGWTGKRYHRTSPASDGTYEAVVYSNVEAPTMGRKFGSAEPGTGDGRAFEYTLVDGVLSEANAVGVGGTGTTFVSGRVAFSEVTRTAGTETFHLPDPNDLTQTKIQIPGSYHGVSGHYFCTPTTPGDGCDATIAAGGGFTFVDADTWEFRPGNANARVLDATDTAYASYGWWIHKTENDLTYTASAFTDEVGTEDAASTGLNALNGTATYVGGAAGKYALASSTGGTNDAGHFTAKATLEADFDVNTDTDATTNGITGTIDNFMGADGMPRNWSIELKGSPIADTGGIGDATDGTVWTIDGTAAKASGQWSGTLRNNGTDLVPQVVTGTFYSQFGTIGNAGRIVGGFGANKQ